MFELKGDKKIYVVTNRHLIKEGNLCEVVGKCAARGADAVILREKDLGYEELKEVAQKVKKVTDKHHVPLIVNGNVDVALDVNASGFHTSFKSFKELSSSEEFLEKARLADEASGFALGVSVHSTEEAVEAERLGASYLLAGHVYETACKRGLKGRGIKFIEDMCARVCIPVIAIGGINESNIKEVLETKASGVAIMSRAMKIK